MIEIDGHHLTISDVVAVARRKEPVSLSTAGKEAILRSRGWLEQILREDKPVYGINTGFGIFAEQRIKPEARDRLSRNLILSHAVATGTPFPDDIVRAGMLIRANTLARGHSGVRVEVVDTLLEMLNRDVVPVVPEQGSLGSSGDLALLSHLALVFTTDPEDRAEDSGWARFKGEILRGKDAMEAAGLKRLVLGAKEGLAINNGATFSAAIAALALYDTQNLLRTAEVALAMSLEAIMGCIEAFDVRIHAVRGHPGQEKVAEHIRHLTAGSTLLGRAQRVQDAYSLRCAPQVQGMAWDTFDFVTQIIEREINAATDNPLLFEGGAVLSGGNFHGEPVGMAMDFLGVAMAEVAAISERRIFRLTDGKLNGGLPPMLVDFPDAAGLNSGLMMPQYTAASLVLENQTLAHPDSVHSLPTSGEQEDHNANATTAARHARQIVLNTAHVIAIELYTAARALDLRLRQYPDARLGQGTQEAYSLLRKYVPYQAGDAWWGPEIEKVRLLVEEGIFAQF
ncbi:MAG: histidine ammonia-lyase [Thermanaerothrix sp.]|uniref:histidine ammonia-lyase n=1 Tax=Thermanaerothrix sp. TaxID=2972675 RepID=UPI003C7EB98D